MSARPSPLVYRSSDSSVEMADIRNVVHAGSVWAHGHGLDIRSNDELPDIVTSCKLEATVAAEADGLVTTCPAPSEGRDDGWAKEGTTANIIAVCPRSAPRNRQNKLKWFGIAVTTNPPLCSCCVAENRSQIDAREPPCLKPVGITMFNFRARISGVQAGQASNETGKVAAGNCSEGTGNSALRQSLCRGHQRCPAKEPQYVEQEPAKAVPASSIAVR